MVKYPSALHELSSQNFLKLIWNDFYRQTPKNKRQSSGSDNINFIEFENLKDHYFKQIRRELLTKKYIHQPLDIFPLEKPGKNNDYRIICIPTLKDRLIQKALLQLLSNKGFSHESKISFGCSQSRSVSKALSFAVMLRNQYPYVYKTDITSFFDNIQRPKIKSIVEKKIKLRSLHQIIFQAINIEAKTSIDSRIKDILLENGIVSGKGLRQGLPISPLLSNLYLSDFDEVIYNSNFKTIRYADDLAIFCKTEAECRRAHELCKSELLKLGLKVPEINKKSKTVIYTPKESTDFLGLSINKKDDKYILEISKQQIDKIRKKYESYMDVEQNVINGIMFSNLVNKLNALENSYKGHYGDAQNYENFERCIKRWKKDVLENIFKEGYQMDISLLSTKQKQFLHFF